MKKALIIGMALAMGTTLTYVQNGHADNSANQASIESQLNPMDLVDSLRDLRAELGFLKDDVRVYSEQGAGEIAVELEKQIEVTNQQIIKLEMALAPYWNKKAP